MHFSFWSLIDVPETAYSSAVISIEDAIYFCVPQTNLAVVQVYKFINNKFVTYTNITSPHVKIINLFQIRFENYVVVDGYSSGIFKFTDDGFIRQNLVHGNTDGIHYWLPVPVHTYRNEVILLAERALEHDTHMAYTVEIIVNNGGKVEKTVSTNI